MTALTVGDVAKSYGTVRAVDGASLDLAAGQVTCLLGPSGCGKSTLLRLIAGLERIDRGTIAGGGTAFTDGATHLPPEKRNIGLVFQDQALFPHLDLAGNIGFGLNHLARAEREGRVATLLDRFRIAHRAAAFPRQLSGGEQQRAAIARALAREPAVLLMDEPFSGLDGALRREVQDSILAGLQPSGAAVLIVTHDASEAMRLGDRIVLMDEGRTLQSGTPEQCYTQPVSAAAARLLGPVNIVPGVIRGGIFEGAVGRMPAADQPDGPAVLLARPEAFALADGSDGFELAVASSAYLGDRYELAGRVGGVPMLVRLAVRPAISGGTLRCTFPDDAYAIVPDRA